VKHLPKHLRPRWRYLAVELEGWPDADLDRRAFQSAVWDAGRGLLGASGSADARLRVLQFVFARGAGEAVVRARRGEVGPARAALACVDAVDGEDVRVRVRGVSGTVRACEEKYLDGVADPSEERVEFRGEDRRATGRGDRIDIEIDGCFTGATRFNIE
jgi:ribonuclease P/MRP protein subunit POP5